MSNTALDIHRLLDEAFVGIEVTPEVQDLKEEMRANLVARVEELQASGAEPGEVARRAIAELGDVRAIVDETVRVAGDAPSWQRHRVRPRPAYVVRTVLVALVAAAALGIVVLRLAGLVSSGGRSGLDVAAAIAVAALAGGFLTGDALRQETTTSHPVPRRRAVGYGVATTAGLGGLGGAIGYVLDRALAWPIIGAALLVASIAIFTYLGVTQTNRHKPWVIREMARHERAADRFEQDPGAAARFGLYTAATWIVALTAFVVVGLTVGWAWSLLALLGGVVVMMLTLARMLFGGDARQA